MNKVTPIFPKESHSIQHKQSLFTVNGLSVHYGGRKVLCDTKINIISGQITALMGPSGCGKSTFLSCLNRMIDLVPSALVSGEILFDGYPIFSRKSDPVMLRRRIGMIFQCPNLFPFSIRENLAFPLRVCGRPTRENINDRMEQTLALVGLWVRLRIDLEITPPAFLVGNNSDFV